MIELVGHGYLGRAIARELERQDIRFEWDSHDSLDPFGHDLIINAAGFVGEPNADACEVRRLACVTGNVSWPLVIEECAHDIPVLHIGSGCLYHGGPHKENDPPGTPLPFYSECRVLMEKALRPYLVKSYLLRIRQPFGSMVHPHNLLCKLARYPKLVNHRNSITCAEDLAKVVAFFVRNRPEPGIYNCTNPGAVSNREIADALGLHKEWMTETEFMASVKAPRTVCTLDTSKLERLFPMRHVTTALKDSVLALRQKRAA